MDTFILEWHGHRWIFFGRTYRLLPGKNGATKGMVFGLFGWAMMGLLYYPLLGLGLFAIQIGLGIAPALFSLAIVLTYSVVTGMSYAALDSCSAFGRRPPDA